MLFTSSPLSDAFRWFGTTHRGESLEQARHYGAVKTVRAKPQVARFLVAAAVGVLGVAAVAAIVAVAVELGLESALLREVADGAPDQLR